MNKKYPLLVLLLGISSQFLFSQVLDEAFKFGLTKAKTDARFQALAKQADGKIIAIGNQYFVNGSMQRGIMRLNADLSVDESFTGMLPQTLFFAQNAIAIQDDGKIVLAGVFGNGPAGEIFMTGILRLNSDGTVDESFDPGTGFDLINNIRALGIDQDGKYIAFGSFTSYNGQAANGVARINPDGTLDNTFNVPGFSISTGQIDDLYIQPDGKVILANSSMKYGGVAVPDVIRLNTDGSLDNTFAYTGPLAAHYLLLPEPAGDKIIVICNDAIARIDSDGSVDNTYSGTTGHLQPRAAVRQPDDKIVVAGGSTVIRFNTDGTVDNSFTFGGVSGNFRGVSLDNDGNIVLANANGTDMQLLDPSGTALTSVNLNHTEPASAFPPEIINDQVIIAGNFEYLDGNPVKSIFSADVSSELTSGFDYYTTDPVTDILRDGDHFFATNNSNPGAMVRVNSDGSLDTEYTTNILGLAGNGESISIVKRLSNGKILIGGSFDSFNEQPGTSKLVLLNKDGSIDNAFSSPTGLTNIHNATELPDGRIVIADLTTNKDTLRLISATGTLDPDFKVGFDIGMANDLNADAAGNIYAGGNINAVNGVAVNSLVKISTTGVPDQTFIAGTGFSGSVNSIAIQRDQKLLVGGVFTSYNGVKVNQLARLNTDGTLDDTFIHEFYGPVGGVTIYRGDIYVTGSYVRSFSPFSGSIARYTTDILTPASLVGTSDCSSANLTWSDNSTDETGFNIERAANIDGLFEVVATVGANTVNYKDEGLGASMDYHYRVKAVNGIGETAPTYVLTVSTQPVPSITSTSPAERCGEGTIVLNATAGHGDINWYDAEEDGTLLGSGTTFTTPAIEASATYYAVATTGSEQCSSESTAVSATINPLPEVTTIVNGNSITANATDVTYQWITCENEAPIPEETEAMLEIFSTGNYAVTVTKDGCSTTSECVEAVFTGFEKIPDNQYVFPNPSKGRFSIWLGDAPTPTDVKVMTINGKLVYAERLSQISSTEIDLASQPSGMYILTLADGKTIKYLKLLIE